MNAIHKIILITGLFALVLTIDCYGNSFTDERDGKKYKAVKIGKQVWMAENLNYEADGSKCYDNKAENCAKYGRLYDWNMAMKVCPKGWHLPKNEEWDVLYKFVDSSYITKDGYSKLAGKYLKAKTGWNEDGNGIDTYGFTALPGGYGYSYGSFRIAGYYGSWWSATEDNASYAHSHGIGYNYEDTGWYNIDEDNYWFSVRCVRD